MSEENLAIVRTLLDRFKVGDSDVFEYYDTDIEWDARRGSEHVPDIANLYRGHEGVRAYWRAWLTAWRPIEDWSYELRDAGDSVVAVISGQRNVGRSSGIEVEIPPYGLLFTLREGKVVRWAFYSSIREACESAGIPE